MWLMNCGYASKNPGGGLKMIRRLLLRLCTKASVTSRVKMKIFSVLEAVRQVGNTEARIRSELSMIVGALQ